MASVVDSAARVPSSTALAEASALAPGSVSRALGLEIPSTEATVSAGEADAVSTRAVFPVAGAAASDVSRAPVETASADVVAGLGAVGAAGSTLTGLAPDDVVSAGGASVAAGVLEEAFSGAEAVASAVALDEDVSVAAAVAPDPLLVLCSTVAAGSAAEVAPWTEEAVVSVAVCEGSCVGAVALSTVVAVLAGASTGSGVTVVSLKVGPLVPCLTKSLLTRNFLPRFRGAEPTQIPDFSLGHFPTGLP
jgi:hypothetical protein